MPAFFDRFALPSRSPVTYPPCQTQPVTEVQSGSWGGSMMARLRQMLTMSGHDTSGNYTNDAPPRQRTEAIPNAAIDHRPKQTIPPSSRTVPGSPQHLKQTPGLNTRPEIESSDSDTGQECTEDRATDGLTRILQVDAAAITDVGLRRSHNEDTFAIWERRDRQRNLDRDRTSMRGLYVVCDGMGGHASGEIASQLATQTLIDFFQSRWIDAIPDPETIRTGVLAANQAVYAVNCHDQAQGYGRMGTTLVALWLHDANAMIAHAGDSRLYRYTHRQGLEQLTIDHDIAEESIRGGLSPNFAYRLPHAHRLTQAIGPNDNSELEPEIQALTIEEDTLFMLASDGLTDRDILDQPNVPPFDALLEPHTDLQVAATELIEFANCENGHDNTTIILVRILVD